MRIRWGVKAFYPDGRVYLTGEAYEFATVHLFASVLAAVLGSNVPSGSGIPVLKLSLPGVFVRCGSRLSWSRESILGPSQVLRDPSPYIELLDYFPCSETCHPSPDLLIEMVGRLLPYASSRVNVPESVYHSILPHKKIKMTPLNLPFPFRRMS